MNSLVRLLLILFLFTSCGAKKARISSSGATHATKSSNHTPFFDITEYSKDKDYGLSGDNPVKVGEKSVSYEKFDLFPHKKLTAFNINPI